MKPKKNIYHDASIVKWEVMNNDLYISCECYPEHNILLIFHDCLNSIEIIQKLESSKYQPMIIGFSKGGYRLVEIDCDIGPLEIHCKNITEI